MADPEKKSDRDSVKEQVLEEYDFLAKDYDEQWLAYTQKTLALTLSALQVESLQLGSVHLDNHATQKSLLDIGCGTGQFLEMLLNTYPNLDLYGIEPNREMLGRAEVKFAKSISFKEAWAHELPFEDASFDVVTCNNMFHYVDEPFKALSEFKRVLKPEGQMILMDWCGDFWTMSLNAWWLDIRKKAHVKTYKGAELHDMLLDTGFDSVWVESQKVDLFWGMMVARASLNPE